MSAQSDAATHAGIADAAVIPVQRVVGSQHVASETSRTDAIAAQGHPTCLLAIALHEIGRTADTLRAARATGDEALARRVEREQEGWSHLYEFTCQHICPVARMEAIEPEAASVIADAALAAMPPTVPADVLAYVRRSLATCASYQDVNACPFLNPTPQRRVNPLPERAEPERSTRA